MKVHLSMVWNMVQEFIIIIPNWNIKAIMLIILSKDKVFYYIIKGTLFNYDNTVAYKGLFKNGLPNGKGTAISKNGTVLETEWKDGIDMRALWKITIWLNFVNVNKERKINMIKSIKNDNYSSLIIYKVFYLFFYFVLS